MACLNVLRVGATARIAASVAGFDERKASLFIGPRGYGRGTLLKRSRACRRLERLEGAHGLPVDEDFLNAAMGAWAAFAVARRFCVD